VFIFGLANQKPLTITTMKRILTLLILVLSVQLLLAQMPAAFNYQAVARNNAGEALSGQTITVRFSIVSSAAGNPSLYTETRQVTTSAQGVFAVQIGSPGAQSSTGDLGTISWTNNTSATKSLKVELDIHNDGNFIEMGTQSLVSVPYAFAANKAIDALNIGGHYVDTNTPELGDVLQWNGSAWVAEEAPRSKPRTFRYVKSAIPVSGGSLAFAWAAQPQLVTVEEGDIIVATISGSVACTTGTANSVGYSLAYQMSGGSITCFTSSDYAVVDNVDLNRTPVTSSGVITIVSADKPTLAPGELWPGTYNIGFAIRNTSPYNLNPITYFTGYILIH
jgi:hypothetical protein